MESPDLTEVAWELAFAGFAGRAFRRVAQLLASPAAAANDSVSPAA